MDTYLLTQIGLFFVGIVVLYLGAEWTVKGSSHLATQLGVQPIIVGITIIALGTSSPELIVGIVAALRGEGASDIALGNVIGSNIANIGLIVGVAGLICPLQIRKETLKYEIPMMVSAALALYVMCILGNQVSRVDGIILVAMGVGFNIIFVRKALRDSKAQKAIEKEVQEVTEVKDEGKGRNIALCVVGIIGLGIGAHLMVESATLVAKEYWGWSYITIGLTIIAIGTSLPELAASSMASIQKQSDLALGNVVGSNIYNVVLIIGVVALIQPLSISHSTIAFEIPIMLIFTAVMIFFLVTGMELVRWEASLLLIGYFAFLGALFYQQSNNVVFYLF